MIPDPSDLMRVRADRHPEGPGQAEVGQLDLPLGVDEKVLGLQVPVEDPVGVTEGKALQQLEEVALPGGTWEDRNI